MTSKLLVILWDKSLHSVITSSALDIYIFHKRSFKTVLGVGDWKLSPMGKINLQWSDLAFIIRYNDANSFEKVKNTLFIKNVLQKTYFLPKTRQDLQFFAVLRMFAVSVIRPDISSWSRLIYFLNFFVFFTSNSNKF